jgi:carbamate kinase
MADSVGSVLVAIGGNAAYPPTIKGYAEEQLALMEAMCEQFVDILRAGYRLVLTHGNGPVVGNILFRMAKTAIELPPMPMDICVAHSQGGIGYMLQQTLQNVLRRHALPAEVAALVTQVEVDADDPAFAHPTKPVGRFLSKADAALMAERFGWVFVEDSGRGYRRVVPSPDPKRLLGLAALHALIDRGVIPIVAGGGGIPVARDDAGRYRGVPAVIDKDLSSALVAAGIRASHFMMLTGVDRVALDFGKPTQRALDVLDARDARRYLAEGQFPPGSMGPKIAAALRYIELGGAEALVTSLDRAADALAGRAGTRIRA